MGPDNHLGKRQRVPHNRERSTRLQVVQVQELLHAVRSESHQARPPRVRPQPGDAIVLGGVAEERGRERAASRSSGAANLQSKSMRTAPPFSIVSGRWRSSSCSTVSIDRPIPPEGRQGSAAASTWRDRTVHTDNPLLNHRRKRHPVEQSIEALPGPDAVLLACARVSREPQTTEGSAYRGAPHTPS